MGMAPLANVGTEEDSFIEEKVANLVYVFAQRFYSFSGLQRYKIGRASCRKECRL